MMLMCLHHCKPCRAFKTVVFVIDQLEAFMRAAKQTLLYNVLDALQHSQVQVSRASPASGWQPLTSSQVLIKWELLSCQSADAVSHLRQ
jgi:hypothetical protein